MAREVTVSPSHVLLVAEPRPEPESFLFLSSHFYVMLSYFDSSHFKELRTFPSPLSFTHQINSFTLVPDATT